MYNRIGEMFMCNRCVFMEGKEALPKNSVKVFYEVYPSRSVKQLVIDTANLTIGFLSTDDEVDGSTLPRDKDGRVADHAILPISYIEVPIIDNGVLLEDIRDAVDQLPDNPNVDQVADFMWEMLQDDERYIPVDVRSMPHPMELLMGLLGAIVNSGEDDRDRVVH